MLSKGIRIILAVGIVLVLLALGMHFMMTLYRAPADAEFNLLTQFAATFASTILTFFIGALLFDYQVERTEARRGEQLRMLLVAELSEILDEWDHANAMKVGLPDGSVAEVVITYLQSMVVEEAVRSGFSHPSWRVGEALRLATRMSAYNAKVSYLMSILSSDTRGETDSGQFLAHAIEEIEETRQEIVAGAHRLAKQG